MCTIPILENDAVMLGAEGQRFWLAGLGDQIAYRLGQGRFRGVDDLAGTLAQVRADDPVLLLADEPDIFPRVPPRVALTLPGHTHGGQIRLPLIWPALVPSRYGARFAYGHVVENDRHPIVSYERRSGSSRRSAGNRSHRARRVGTSRNDSPENGTKKNGAESVGAMSSVSPLGGRSFSWRRNYRHHHTPCARRTAHLGAARAR
jgi:hypothetical protein